MWYLNTPRSIGFCSNLAIGIHIEFIIVLTPHQEGTYTHRNQFIHIINFLFFYFSFPGKDCLVFLLNGTPPLMSYDKKCKLLIADNTHSIVTFLQIQIKENQTSKNWLLGSKFLSSSHKPICAVVIIKSLQVMLFPITLVSKGWVLFVDFDCQLQVVLRAGVFVQMK